MILETEHRIRSELAPADGPSGGLAGVSFTVERGLPEPLASAREVLHESTLAGVEGESLVTLFRNRTGALCVRYSGTAEFVVGRDRIHCRLFDPEWEFWVEIALLGPILAFWLELRGRIALHASAVVEGRGAWGFLAASAGGKSVLAAAMMRSGSAFLTDDILAVIVSDGVAIGAPGPPTQRLWPELLRELGEDPERWPRAHPHFEKRRFPAWGWGRVHDRAAPLEALLVPIRQTDQDGTGVALRRIEGPEALVTLARGAFATGIVESIPEIQVSRMERLAGLVRSVPLYELHYPAGIDALSRVGDELRRYLDPGSRSDAAADLPRSST